MFPEPTELLLIGCSTESIWTQRSKSNMLTPKTQLADMLTKESFTRDEWNHLLRLFNIMSFSMLSCSHFSNFLFDLIGKHITVSKRRQEATWEGSPVAKLKPMIPAKVRRINLVSHSPWGAKENPPQDLRYRVNPVNVDEGQGRQTSTRRLERTAKAQKSKLLK